MPCCAVWALAFLGLELVACLNPRPDELPGERDLIAVEPGRSDEPGAGASPDLPNPQGPPVSGGGVSADPSTGEAEPATPASGTDGEEPSVENGAIDAGADAGPPPNLPLADPSP